MGRIRGSKGVGARRLALLVVLAVAVVAATVGTAVAAFPSDNVRLYTGCLTAGGSINSVKEGDAPSQPCASPKQVVKLSGGDITSLTVSAPLTGGGDNGALAVGLDAKFTLPAGCTDGQVPKWNALGQAWACRDDRDTTYTAGTGLSLSGGAFSIVPSYRLPQCLSGQITRFNPGSGWVCADLDPGRLHVATAAQGAAIGLPDGAGAQDVVSLALSGGTWVVMAKAVLNDGEDDRGFRAANGDGCVLVNGTGELDTAEVTLADSNDGRGPIDFPLAMTGVTDGGTTVKLQCFAQQDADQVEVSQGRLVAFKVD